MRFLADMGVATRIVEWLRERGHDATHLRDEGLHRFPNGEVFKKAVMENRILLTFDLDFGEIAALAGRQLVSVIIFRLRNTRTPHVWKRLEQVLMVSADSLEKGVIVIVEETRHRVRKLPIAPG
jgi:predicted nuclease of predicted toxin-antitoxin system